MDGRGQNPGRTLHVSEYMAFPVNLFIEPWVHHLTLLLDYRGIVNMMASVSPQDFCQCMMSGATSAEEVLVCGQ